MDAVTIIMTLQLHDLLSVYRGWNGFDRESECLRCMPENAYLLR